MDLASPPAPSAFFASRKGVCVYVSVEGQNVRVCFASTEAEGRVESDASARTAAAAVAIATEVFRAHRNSLGALFEAIESQSRVE